jgi:hypothetical protein
VTLAAMSGSQRAGQPLPSVLAQRNGVKFKKINGSKVMKPQGYELRKETKPNQTPRPNQTKPLQNGSKVST